MWSGQNLISVPWRTGAAISIFFTNILGYFSLIALPIFWIWVAATTVLQSLCFCLVAPLRRYLEPLEAAADRASSYEEWKEYQARLDEKRQVHRWSRIDQSTSYDWRGLRQFKHDFESARRRDDVAALCGHLRAQATRNCCSLLSPQLYLKSRLQTKRLIHDYVREVCRCVERLVRRESSARPGHVLLEQERHRLIGDVRQTLGRTTLVLQGGANLSLCHFGVVRALHRRGMLPRIITATGTGAIAASMVGCTPDEDLLDAMQGSAIDISAFVRGKEQRSDMHSKFPFLPSWPRAVLRRTMRFIHNGHFFEIDILAQCIRDNIGDITFEEAYAKSGRVLNITIAKANIEGTPQLLNHITAPHVLVWSAVIASVATSKRMFAAVTLKCKNDVGVIDRYFAVDSSTKQMQRSTRRPQIPLERIGELFDVNHYIVSQTRPYIVPFARLREFMCQDPILGAIIRVVYCEFLHRLEMLGRMGFLPRSVQRITIDELIPSTSNWSKFVIAPEVSLSDVFKILNFPSPQVIDYWAMKGERSVWPKICQLKVRCGVEFCIDAAYRREINRAQTTTPHSPPIKVNGNGWVSQRESG